MTWDTKKVLAMAAIVVALTQLGHGLKAASWLIGVPEVAYAAKEQAETVDEKFQLYLQRQEAYTEALNAYVAQQQGAPTHSEQANYCEEDERGQVWCCPHPDPDVCDTQQLWRRRK